MTHVSILIPHGHTSLVNIEGSFQIFSTVNGFLAEMGRDPVFDVHLVGLSRETRQTTGLFTVIPDMLVGEVAKTDLIIIPAIHGDPHEAVERNRDFIPWIVEMRTHGAEVASLCVGAFFLAATGLLTGRECSTHWMHAADFRRMFPDVHLVEDRIMTESDGLYTSGGAYSAVNLLLYLVEKHAGRDIAILAAKAFMVDIDRHSQSPFIIFKGQRAHGDDLVIAIQDTIETRFGEKLTVEQLAESVSLARRSLERRFRKATGNSVAQYLQRVRVEAAKKQLETGASSIVEVMHEVGYTDVKAFRKVFRDLTGMTPLDYRRKYNLHAL